MSKKGIFIPIEVSARHLHLSAAHYNKLFGEKAKMHLLRPVSQPGQFVTRETVAISTKKGSFSQVRIVGPCRPQTQFELTKTDARSLGIDPPLKRSGLVLQQGETLILKGPQGLVRLRGGAIIAQRHIHASTQDARKYGLKKNKIVRIEVSGERGGVFENVIVRVHPKFKWAFHLDTDEANAFGISGNTKGRLL